MSSGSDKNKWEERYASPVYAYGKTPNKFFEEWLLKFKPGTILMPADGEGRNGVFAALNGWRVTSTDQSEQGQLKALQLAAENGVPLDYVTGDFGEMNFPPASFDAIGLIFAHFPGDKKSGFHQLCNTFLKPGGIVIFEAYSKQHLQYKEKNPEVGGPNDITMLFSTEELFHDFPHYEIILLEEKEVLQEEGIFHNGLSSVIRFVGRKQ
ncbi:bifunctional 2-polyprenyl-6-hydroxyphenol methylase/3-demethylubiquinol 3-O-methyltransferase UbiG [Chitinophaga sp. Cy-1792]|uniref:class I SAM-dependent methyltransferase n=1 Tax=Chitinophaga sp. Cy-1792 TaxID=2608339 RepID=UPI00141E3F14|nr:class I SAM-dependent methyltransferase [Chitinophaga sp. Cy-1792]NIG55452.1 class I SAM-dependent methyltransferase [Chitinophaga sp. Cy-1792]